MIMADKDAKLLCLAHSPNQKLQLELLQDPDTGINFRMMYEGTPALSSVGLCFPDAASAVRDLRLRPFAFDGTEILLSLEGYAIRILVTDDKAAFRYEQFRSGAGAPFEERTAFRLGMDASLLSSEPEQGLLSGKALSLPALFELDNGLYMSLKRIPNPGGSFVLHMPEGRVMTAGRNGRGGRSGQDSGEEAERADDVTPWWIISFARP